MQSHHRHSLVCLAVLLGLLQVAAARPAQSVDLTVSITESTEPVLAPGTLTYVLSVENNSGGAATNLALDVDLTLPAGTGLVTFTPSGSTSLSGPNWLVGSLAGGASASLTLNIGVDVSAPPGTDVIGLSSSVIAIDQTLDGNVTDDSDSEFTSIVASAVDLVVTAVESIDPVEAPGSLTYLLTVLNDGPDDATGLALSFGLTLPANVGLSSFTPSGTTSVSGTNWIIGNLASGTSRTLTLNLSVLPTATPGADVIGASASVLVVDQNLINTGDDAAAVETSITPSMVDLIFSITESAEPVVAGSGPGNLAYLLSVRNDGPSDATNLAVSVNLTLPAGVGLSSFNASGSTNLSGTAWAIGSLPAGATESLTLMLTALSSAAPGTDVVGLDASVLLIDQGLINTGDDTPGEKTSVAGVADLVALKTDGVDLAMPGDTLTYTIAAANQGVTDAVGATVSDTFPTDLTCTWTCAPMGAGASCTAGPVAGDINDSVDLPASGSFVLYTVVCDISPSAPTGILENTVSVTVPAGFSDPNLGDNEATDQTAVNEPPEIASVDPASQTAQYSDAIDPITITATDTGQAPLIIAPTGPLPLGLNLSSNGCTMDASGTECTFTIDGQILEPAGSYAIGFFVADDSLVSDPGSVDVGVAAEDVSVLFDPADETEVWIPAMNSPGGNSGPIPRTVAILESDLPPELAGDISQAGFSMSLTPGDIPPVGCVPSLAPGSPDAGGPFDYDLLLVTCTFDDVPIGDYQLEVEIDISGFYEGSAQAPLSIVDPCPIPHDGSDTDGDGLPDACDCPCFNVENLVSMPPNPGVCHVYPEWGFNFTTYSLAPEFYGQAWDGFCRYQAGTLFTETPISVDQFPNCQETMIEAAELVGGTCTFIP